MELDAVLSFIEKADENMVNCILDAVFDRRSELFPAWETVYFALPRNDKEERIRLARQALDMLIRE